MTAHQRLDPPLVESIRKALTGNALPGETKGLSGDAEREAAEFLAQVATNRTRGRMRGLMGRRRFDRGIAALEALRESGRIPATFEVIYGHAWKVAPRHTAEGYAIVKLQRPGRA